MVTDEENQFTKFVKRWTITVTYIALMLTIIVGIRVYEVFWKG